MTRFLSTSTLAALALLALPTVAQADTSLDGWTMRAGSTDADGVTTQRVLVDTSGTEVPDAVGVTLTSDLGDVATLTMDSPHSGTVLTRGSLDLLIQPEGGTATLVLLGLGNGLAIGDEFEVLLPLHPEDGGEADFSFDGGDGVVSAFTTPIEGEVDAYSVTVSVDFDISGDVDVADLEYFDMTVQEVDGDVSVIDEQAELYVDGSNLRWRGTLETESTTAIVVRYDAELTATSSDGTSLASAESSGYRVDYSDGETPSSAVLSSTVNSRDRSAGGYKLVLKQNLLVVGDTPTSNVDLYDEDGSLVGSIEPTVLHTSGLFAFYDIEYAESAVGKEITVLVDMISADGETLGTEEVTMTVRAAGSSKEDLLVSLADVHVYAFTAVEQLDGSVTLSVAIGGDDAGDVTDLSIALSGTGPVLVSESEMSAAREAQLMRMRGTLNVDVEYDQSTLSIDSELTDADGEVIDTVLGKDKTEKPKTRRRYTRRRAMKTAMPWPGH